MGRSLLRGCQDDKVLRMGTWRRLVGRHTTAEEAAAAVITAPPGGCHLGQFWWRPAQMALTNWRRVMSLGSGGHHCAALCASDTDGEKPHLDLSVPQLHSRRQRAGAACKSRVQALWPPRAPGIISSHSNRRLV